mgnify:CR=1 FL=1
MIEKILDKSKLISLEEESHTYTLLNSNIHFQSVTEFIHTFFKPFEEKKVAAKLTEKHPKYIGMSIEELIKNWNERRDRGTLVHKQIENFILEKKNLSLDSKTAQGINFLKKHCIKNSNILLPEVIIYSEALKIAGTIDLIIFNQEKNHISIVDWKTNKKINKSSFKGIEKGIKYPVENMDDCNFMHYTLQLSVYQYILENYYNVTVNGLILVHLKENQFEYIQCDFKKEIVKQMIETI